MRIGIASTFPPYRGGIAQFNAAMVDALKAAGHEVSMATWSRQYPNWLFPGTSQWEPNKSLSDVHIPASLDSLSPLSWARTGRALAAASDVVVLPFWHAALAPALTGVARAAKKHGVKKVFALMHNASSHDGNAMHKALTTRFLGCVDGVLTLSQPVSELLKEWQPHTLFHPLYDHHKAAVRKAEAQRQLGIDKDRVVHLYFGLIRPYKGLDVLLKAMAELPGHHVLLVAGECYGPWEPYGDAIKALGLEGRIHVHQGFVDDRDVPVFFGAADHVVLPYLKASQSGVTALALHHEKLVIASDVGDLSSTIVPELTGRLVQPNAPADLARAMSQPWSAQPTDVKAAFVSVKKRLSWSAWATQLTQQVESLLSEAR